MGVLSSMRLEVPKRLGDGVPEHDGSDRADMLGMMKG